MRSSVFLVCATTLGFLHTISAITAPERRLPASRPRNDRDRGAIDGPGFSLAGLLGSPLQLPSERTPREVAKPEVRSDEPDSEVEGPQGSGEVCPASIVVTDFLEHDRHEHHKSKVAMEKMEGYCDCMTRTSWWFRRVALRGLAGVALLATGSHFGRLMVVAHTVRVTGWPIVESAMKDMSESYYNARSAVKREMEKNDKLKKPAELLKAVQYELRGVRRVIRKAQQEFKAGTLEETEAEETIRRARVDIERLEREAWMLNQAVDSIAAITGAIDMKKLRNMVKSLYTTALGCVASASSVTVSKLSMSFDLGGIFCNDIEYLMRSFLKRSYLTDIIEILPCETRRFLVALVAFLGASQGLVIARALLPQMSLRLSSAALGAAWVADAISDILDPVLTRWGFEPIHGHAAYVPLHLALTWLGYHLQCHWLSQRKALPEMLQSALVPLEHVEKRLKRVDGLFKSL